MLATLSADHWLIMIAIAAPAALLCGLVVFLVQQRRLRFAANKANEASSMRAAERDQWLTRAGQLNEQKHALELQLVEQRTLNRAMEKRALEYKRHLELAEKKIDEERRARLKTERDQSVLCAQMDERDAHFKRQMAQFKEQKNQLKNEFSALASTIFEEKSKAFSHRSRVEIDTLLKPFREQINGFQQRVNEVHTESVKGNSKLEAQIKSVLEVGIKMSDEATTLASALKGDKKAQGNWGEVQAEMILQHSGLSEGREYLREANFKTEEGRDQRPDFIVNLPNDKHIVLDSKMSLIAYVEAHSAENDDERAVKMRKHVEAIRAHVKSLSEKSYAKLRGVNSPEYVFMFIGNESAYIAAAEFDPSLFQEAYRKGVAIVTPNTLISSLRIVAQLWSIDKQNRHTIQLAEQASKVYDKLRVFVATFEKLGAQVQTIQKTYDASWRTLADGRGSLTQQVDRFVEMGVSVKEKLPASVTRDSDEHGCVSDLNN